MRIRLGVGPYSADPSVRQKPINGSPFRWGVGPSLDGDSRLTTHPVFHRASDPQATCLHEALWRRQERSSNNSYLPSALCSMPSAIFLNSLSLCSLRYACPPKSLAIFGTQVGAWRLFREGRETFYHFIVVLNQ